MFIAWAAMALSVGIENIVGLLVAQQKPGVYGHIMAAHSPLTANPQSVKDLTVYELTENRPIGWVPPAASYGFLLL